MTGKTSDTKLVVREVEITNKLGLHARAAAMFARLAGQFPCEIYVEKDGERVNGKSLMGLLMLAAGNGSKIKLYAYGPEGHRAIEALQALIERKFDEE